MKKEKLVALKYPQNAECPFVVAKGKGETFARLLQIAKDNDVPIVQDKNLVDVLSVLEIGQGIPEETWEALAKIFAFVVDVSDRF